MWIFIEYLEERFGPELIRTMWEYSIDAEGYEILDRALADYDTTIEQAFTGFAVALLSRSFEEGRNYPTVALEGQVSSGNTFFPTDGVGQLAVDFVEVTGSGRIWITLDGLQALGIGYQGQIGELFIVANNEMVVDLDSYDHFYLLVINQQRAGTESSCEFADYSVRVADAGERELSPVAQTRTDPNFRPP